MTGSVWRAAVYGAAATIAGLAPVATRAQDEIAIVGIVRLDGPDAGDVEVRGQLRGRPPGRGVLAARDIFLYMVARTEPEIILRFSCPGYSLQAMTVRLDGAPSISRVTDVQMISIVSERLDDGPSGDNDGDGAERVDDGASGHHGGDGGELASQGRLRAHLESQAAIAREAGPGGIEAFRWNLAEYRHRFARSEALTRQLEMFIREPRMTRLVSPDRSPSLEVYQRLIEARADGRMRLPPEEALRVLANARLPSPVRAAAVDAMMTLRLTEGHRAALLRGLRESTTSSRSPSLLASAFTGLAKLGDSTDRLAVTRATQSTDVALVRAAISGLGRSGIADLDTLTAGVIRTNPSPEVRAVVIGDLGWRIEQGQAVGPAATLATANALRTDTVAAVRMRAVQVLGTMPDSATARSALEAAAADSSRVNVRSAARRVLRRPP